MPFFEGSVVTSTTPGPVLITGGRVIDPWQGLDAIADVLVQDGRVAWTRFAGDGAYGVPHGTQIIDATGMIVAPGFIDLHCHLREPGQEYKETIETGTRAAARGGFTTVCAMPNTEPAIDTAERVALCCRDEPGKSPSSACSLSEPLRWAAPVGNSRIWAALRQRALHYSATMDPPLWITT